ncbi:MAG: 2-oxo acid dehydrogenase subunit E2 [Lachnospiraceae bacterium]|nr:2-oxo acid dehydrogenase subunit E2 [Candidatus Equihabitans merdae]
MASIIIMPKQGLLMEEGTITKWLVQEGGKVVEGEPLFEMETDKLTITMDATASGTMLKIIHPEGDDVPITKPIAIVGEPGEDISALLGDEAPAEAPAEEATAEEAAPAAEEAPVLEGKVTAPGEKVMASPRAKLRAEEKGIDIALVPGTATDKATGIDGYIIEKDVEAYAAAGPKATPLAAKAAAAAGVDLATVAGTGANGKITVADVTGGTAPAAPAAAAAPAAPAAVEGQATRGTRVEPMSRMRKSIMANMLNSKQTNAQTSHHMVVDMTEVVALRKKYKAMDIKVSFNDIIVRACAKALKDYPICNASVDGNNIVYHDYVNIGTAVSVSNGLIVPVIRDADIIGLTGIAEESAKLIGKARDNQLQPNDYTGGTFTVSSLGMFDVDDFVAIINPPESCILAVGKIAKTPVVVTNAEGEDEIAIKQMCGLTLSYDHRIIDGAEAAKFLQKIKKYLQNPILML